MKRFMMYGLLLAGFVLLAADVASAGCHTCTYQQSYEQMLKLRTKEKWLLPPVDLSNTYTVDELDQYRRLKPFLNGNVAQAVSAVEFTFQQGPFGPDSVTRDQARALIQLGMLSHMGHFAVLNARDPNLKAGAVDILGQLTEVANNFKLAQLRSQYQRLATEVGDARYMGGPGATLQKYDATVAGLYDVITNSYGIDGHWYFMFGGASASIFAVATPGNELEPEYFVNVMDDLYHQRPSLSPDYVGLVDAYWTGYTGTNRNRHLQAFSWNTVRYYLLNQQKFANPYAAHEPMPEWDQRWERESAWWWQ